MKRVIFTTFDDIDNSVQTGFDALNTEFTQSQDDANTLLVKEYFDRLVSNKKDYADKIGVDFIFYHNEMKDFDIDAGMEFTKVNLWKHHLMANLAEEYDEVMYVDMDVLFNTDLNVFEEHDLSKGIHVKDNDEDVKHKTKEETQAWEIGLRSPILKYFITKDLLDGRDNHVMNTGILIGQSHHIKQIKFIERTREAIEKINVLKEYPHYINKLYYPNNESIFSYIMEQYNIPYVILDEMWHNKYDDKPKIGLEGHCIHFINKQFNRFFNDKTKAIFSLHIEIPDNKLDNPKSYKDTNLSKSKIAQQQFIKYEKQLIDNHKDYAKAVGAAYITYNRDNEYEEFYKRFPDLSEYDVINLYKVYKLEQLTKEYDLVMYIDLDVCFVNHASIFDSTPCNYAFCCMYDKTAELTINASAKYFADFKKDYRNPESKYWNAHALLIEDDLEPEDNVYNTGIMVASNYVMKQLDYFSDIEDVISTMKKLKQNSMYPENIQASFGYDNETIMAYKVKKNNVSNYRLAEWWHLRTYYSTIEAFYPNELARFQQKAKLDSQIVKWDATIIHFISKNFGLWFDK
jgi:hypothetical protein